MKRDLKLNMAHLSATVDSIQAYLDRTKRLENACTTFLNVLKKQDSVSYNTLSEEWEKDIIGYIGEIEERLETIKTMLSGYIDDMKSYVSPESEGVMMRVDRNDIYYNISQIADGILKVNEIAYDSGSSFPDYKHFFVNWWSKEADAIRQAEEQERIRREHNYNKLAEFRSGGVSSAFTLFRGEVDEIWSIYNNAIIPFENTDDDYSYQARFYYDMWATTLNELEDLGKGVVNTGRGLWDAAVDMLDGIFSLGLVLIYESIPCNEFIPLPEVLEQRITGVETGVVTIFTDPVGVIEAMGQSMTDTYEEEGMAYAVGYLSLDVIVELVATKGLGSAKGAAKAADTATDAAEAAKNVERLADAVDTATDAAGAAKKVEKVTDVAGTAQKADTATDAAGAVYTVDKVEETSDAAKVADKATDAVEKAREPKVKGGTESGSNSYSGEEWCRYFRETYGNNNVTWENATPSQLARSWQGSGKYIGIDEYTDVTVNKGTILYRGEPNGTEYFTTLDAIEQSGRNATTIFEGLQVEKNPIHGYRGEMQGYLFNEDVASAYGITNANPQFGNGGLPQYYVPDVQDLISKGILTPVDNIKLYK